MRKDVKRWTDRLERDWVSIVGKAKWHFRAQARSQADL